MPHRTHRKDANQAEMVKALRGVGVAVCIIESSMDLLTGYRGVLRILEIKDGAKVASQRRLRPSQKKFLEDFAGCPVFKVESMQEAFAVHGIRITSNGG